MFRNLFDWFAVGLASVSSRSASRLSSAISAASTSRSSHEAAFRVVQQQCGYGHVGLQLLNLPYPCWLDFRLSEVEFHEGMWRERVEVGSEFGACCDLVSGEVVAGLCPFDVELRVGGQLDAVLSDDPAGAWCFRWF